MRERIRRGICRLLALMLLIATLGYAASCGKKPDGGDDNRGDNGGGDVTDQPDDEELFSYYPKFTMGEELYYIKMSDMTAAEYTMVSSLQGILSQNGKASIYIDARDTDPQQSYAVWREDLEENFGLSFTYIKDPYALVDLFAEEVSARGYALYDGATINGATVVSGMERFLLSDETTALKLEQRGFTKAADCAAEGKKTSGLYDKVIFERYKEKLNKSLIFHQSPQKRQLRDYVIATRSYCFYAYNLSESSAEGKFAREVYEFTDKDIPVLGWAEDELSFVDLNSAYGKITIASDWSDNLSFLGAVKPFDIKQSNYESKEIVPESGKHYAAVVMSDGDNVQWYEGGFINHPKYYANDFKGTFPITYGISPSLADLAPNLMQKIYNRASAGDYFVAAASGQGYINAAEYSEVETFARRTNDYMKKADVDYMTFLDEGTLETMDASFWKEFAKYDNIKGGMWMYGDKYAGGKGAVHWSNGKPLVAFRDGLWEEDPRRVAERVNSYKKDYTAIEGYSLINAHCWSTPFDLIKRFCDSLSKDVVLVTAEQLFSMVTKYVPKTDKVYLDDVDPYDANAFAYSKANDRAYMSQSARLQAVSGTFGFEAAGAQWGVNLADDISVKLVGGAGIDGSKALKITCLRDNFSGENAYVMLKLDFPADAATGELRFSVKGNSRYRVKIVNLFGGVEILQGEKTAADGYEEIAIPLGAKAKKSCVVIIEQNGAGELYLDNFFIRRIS